MRGGCSDAVLAFVAVLFFPVTAHAFGIMAPEFATLLMGSMLGIVVVVAVILLAQRALRSSSQGAVGDVHRHPERRPIDLPVESATLRDRVERAAHALDAARVELEVGAAGARAVITQKSLISDVVHYVVPGAAGEVTSAARTSSAQRVFVLLLITVVFTLTFAVWALAAGLDTTLERLLATLLGPTATLFAPLVVYHVLLRRLVRTKQLELIAHLTNEAAAVAPYRGTRSIERAPDTCRVEGLTDDVQPAPPARRGGNP